MLDTCPYEVRVSPQFGRYLVAARDLGPRETIISEDPVIEGPTDEPGNIPLCLGCCAKLTENQYSRCSKCHFPLCGVSCEQGSLHAAAECKIFQGNHVSFPPPHTKHVLNKSIIILRCLLLKNSSDKKWDQLMTMSDNNESRRNRPNCIIADERILENLRHFLPSREGEDDDEKEDKATAMMTFDTQEVIRLSGILDVNAHAFPFKGGDGKVIASKCHIYFKTSLIAHSCSPNASWAADKASKTRLVIRTNVPIGKGDLICVAYDDSDLLYGTLRRLIPMEVSGMFICKCARCVDPTEFGTFLSALKCQECPRGYLLSLNPTNSFSEWKCNSCARVVEEVYISQVINELERAVGLPKKDLLTEPDSRDDVVLLKEYVDEFAGSELHPNHYIIQEVNLRIVRALCYSLQDLGKDELDDFLQRCAALLRIGDVLIPGFGEFRAFVAYHYFRGLLAYQENAPISFLSSKADKAGAKTDLQKFLARYKLILQLQTEVVTFLLEKFALTSPRVKYVQETMEFVKEQIKILERASSSSSSEE